MSRAIFATNSSCSFQRYEWTKATATERIPLSHSACSLVLTCFSSGRERMRTTSPVVVSLMMSADWGTGTGAHTSDWRGVMRSPIWGQ